MNPACMCFHILRRWRLSDLLEERKRVVIEIGCAAMFASVWTRCRAGREREWCEAISGKHKVRALSHHERLARAIVVLHMAWVGVARACVEHKMSREP
jgi:hypothetical protein